MGLFSRTPPPPLPERPDLEAALAKIENPYYRRRFEEPKHLRASVTSALDSELLADNRILAIIEARPGIAVVQVALILSDKHLLLSHSYFGGDVSIPLKLIWDAQYSDYGCEVAYGPTKKAIFHFATSGRESIEFFQAQLKNAITAQQESEVTETVSHADELAKFAKLRDEGVLTSEEFEAKKARILNL